MRLSRELYVLFQVYVYVTLEKRHAKLQGWVIVLHHYLEKLKKQLRNDEFKSSRTARKLAGSDSIYYMQSGDKTRLFFRYSATERRAIKILAESNKDQEQDVIANLKRKYN